MLAAVLDSPGSVSVREIDTPGPPPPGWVAIAPRFVGICGSDVHLYRGELADHALDPRVLGHELSGVVTQLGEGVDAAGLGVGTEVVVWPLEPCGECDACRRGRENACYRLVIVGVHRDGALAERVLMPAERVFATSAPADAAAFTEPLSVGVHALSLAGVTAATRADGLTVAVVGAGPIGQGVVLALTEWGARVAVIDPVESRRELAMGFGAEAGLWSPDGVVDEVLEWAGGVGAEIVIDSTGVASAFEQSVRLARRTGTIVMVGLTSATAPFGPGILPAHEVNVIGSNCALRPDFATAVALVERRRDDVAKLLSHRFPLTETAQALETAGSGASDVMKVLVRI